MWYYFGASSPQASSPNDPTSPSTKMPGSAAAVTPATQKKALPPNDELASNLPSLEGQIKPFAVDNENSSPAWLSRYTDHLVEQVTLAGAADEPEPLKAARAPLAVPAAKADRTPKASGFRIFQDEKSNTTPTKAEATLQAKRNGGRRPLSLTPKGGLGGLFLLSPSRFSVSPPAMPLANSTNRPDNVTPPNAGVPRPRLQKRTKKIKSVRRLEETGVFDQENIAPQVASHRGMPSRMPGFVVV